MSKPLIGLFAGSFDPFTIGHDDLVRRALGVVDELHILVGINVGKQYDTTPEQRVEQIARLYANEPRITVAPTRGSLPTMLVGSEPPYWSAASAP